MAITLAQSAAALYGSSPTATLAASPTSGNLLTAVTNARSGDSGAALTGFTKIFERNVLSSDSTYRREVAFFAKISNGTETSVSPTWSGSSSNAVTYAEWNAGTGRAWDVVTGAVYSSGDNGAVSNGTSISTGTTASTANQIGIAVGVWKNNGGGGSGSLTYTLTGYTEAVQADALSSFYSTGNGQLWQEFSTTATRGGTMTMGADTSDNNTGLIGGIVVLGHSASDTTAPVLSSPTGTKTGSTTASGAVSTDEGNGTLYFIATVNATETAATIKAGSSQSVSATGSQSVSFTGLTASTTYYAHYVHDDVAANTSNVVNSASFTTDAASSGQLMGSIAGLGGLAGMGGIAGKGGGIAG